MNQLCFSFIICIKTTFLKEKHMKSNIHPLSKSKENKQYKVISVNVSNQIFHRILDLGIIPGTIIKTLQKSPSGDPVAYLVRGSVIALRNKDSKKIIVESM